MDKTAFFYELLEIVRRRQSLSFDEAKKAMEGLMSGDLPDEEMKDFLVAMHVKGEKTDELAGFATTMQNIAATSFESFTVPSPLLDTCGV